MKRKLKMIKPAGGLLLVKAEEIADQTTQSGLVISAAFRDTGIKRGTVVAVGGGEPNALNGELILIPSFKDGDVVLFPDHSGHEIEDNSEKYLLIHYKHIVGTVE